MARKRTRSRSRTRRPQNDPAARERALDALSRMRGKGMSLTQASRDALTTPKTVKKYVGSALTRGRGGHYQAKKSDRLTRHINFLTKDGNVEIAVRGSATASRIARYSDAVDHYLKKGDLTRLQVFEGQFVRSRSEIHFFITDTHALERLAHTGAVSFERLYTRRA